MKAILLTALLSLAVATAAQAHPSSAYQPATIPEPACKTCTLGYPPEAGIGDVTFEAPAVPSTELSPVERYVLAGTAPGSGPGGAKMRAWIDDLWLFVNAYYGNFKTMPSALSLEVLKQMPGSENATSQTLEVFKSPFTDNYPRLDAKQFSKGDVFLKPLSDDELRHIANYDSSIKAIVDGKVHPLGVVWYLRVYGEKKIIYEGLKYVVASPSQ